jgi:succinate dehydrogenase / fumarate reductase cytochrome b subunit
MSTFRRVFSSSVGTKLLIGVTGLALFAYLILHLAGNALIFAGPETFNEYSHALISNPLILPIEIGLLALFLLHVYKAVTNYVANRAARPAGYAMKKYAGHTSRKSVASSTMIWSGLVIFFFIIVHVR